MGFFPQTPSFANPSFLESLTPVTGHSYLLHTLHVFVGKRGLTCMQNVPLLLTHSSDGLSWSVGNFMRGCPIHLLSLASGARRFPPIYPVNGTRLDWWPRCIWCYKLCFNDSGLWCWDATTQAASDDALSQRQGWRGLLFLFFEVHAH